MCVQLQKLCLKQVVTIVLGQVVTIVLGQVVTIVLGYVVTTVLGHVVTTVTTLERVPPMAQPTSCVLTMTERTKILTTTCERFVSFVKPGVLIYNPYWQC